MEWKMWPKEARTSLGKIQIRQRQMIGTRSHQQHRGRYIPMSISEALVDQL